MDLAADARAEPARGGGLARAEYVLCAAVWHTGAHAGSGHYIADVREPTERGKAAQWRRFDDAFVRPVGQDANELLTNCYMYFYLHRSLLDA